MPITRDEARVIMAPLENAPVGQERATLNQIIPGLDKAYGAMSGQICAGIGEDVVFL